MKTMSPVYYYPRKFFYVAYISTPEMCTNPVDLTPWSSPPWSRAAPNPVVPCRLVTPKNCTAPFFQLRKIYKINIVKQIWPKSPFGGYGPDGNPNRRLGDMAPIRNQCKT